MITLLAAVLLSAQATPGACLPRKSASWVTDADYPVGAWRLGLQGVAEFHLAVDARGCPTACFLIRSTGFSELDAATCKLLMERARFKPAEDDKGQPIASTFQGRFRWALPDSRPRKIEPWVARADAHFDANGALKACRSSGQGNRLAVAQFCKFAALVRQEAVAAARGQRGGSYTIHYQGSARFDDVNPALEEGKGALVARAAARFVIDRDGEVWRCDRDADDMGLNFYCDAIRDRYIVPRQRKGEPPFSQTGRIILEFRLVAENREQ